MKAPFVYDLPPERIAQRPVVPYDSAKLLAVHRGADSLVATSFASLPSLLRPSDVLVFNNTKVLPARLFGTFADGGSALEILLVEAESPDRWICLGRPLRRFREGRELIFSEGLRARVERRVDAQRALLQFVSDSSEHAASELLRAAGVMPIPPYIRRGVGDDSDRNDYQTFFAEHEGSIAAPTASLHFTADLVSRIQDRGVRIEFVTLHLGAASFLPLWNSGEEETVAPSPPGEERGFFHAEALERLLRVRGDGGRVIAVGTSAMRLLETAARTVPQGSGVVNLRTDLFIQPGFEFKLVDALVTNFHQPRTTHLLLVEAFLGRSLLQRSYEFALANAFRFLSYGDGMFIE